MKKFYLCSLGKLSALVIIISLLYSAKAYCQNCDECSRPRIGFYDFQFNTPAPTVDSAGSYTQWGSALYSGYFTSGYIRENEQNKNCLTFLDGAMMSSVAKNNGKFKWGMGYPNLPPAGKLEQFDYIVSGIITGGNYNYSITVTIEAAYSREIIASASAKFTTKNEDEKTAAKQIADQVSPILSKIKEFEKNKRNSSTDVAIRDYSNSNSPEEIIVTPEKKKALAGETITVDFKLIDCDGVPLKSRTINLVALTLPDYTTPGPVNGKYNVESVVTDDQGTAKAKFTIGNAEGVSVASASFPHKKPNGRPSCFTGSAEINITPEYIKISGAYMYSMETKGDTSWSISDANGGVDFHSYTNGSIFNKLTIKGIIKRNIQAPVTQKLFDIPVSLAITGNYSQKDVYYSKTEATGGGNTASLIKKDNNTMSGTPITSSSLIQFQLQGMNGKPEFQFFTGIKRKGTMISETIGTDTGEKTTTTPVDDEILSYQMNFADPFLDQEFQDWGKGLYNFMQNKQNNYIEPMAIDGYSLSHNETENYYCVVTMNEAPNMVNNTVAVMPEEYSLSQNYPNPFNPSTNILFTIPKTSYVTLEVYNSIGERVRELLNEQLTGGNYTVKLNADGLPSGVYFYSIKAIATSGTLEFQSVKKVVVLK